MTHSMVNAKIYIRHFYIFDYRSYTTCSNKSSRHTNNTQTLIQRETGKAVAIGEIADLPTKLNGMHTVVYNINTIFRHSVTKAFRQVVF